MDRQVRTWKEFKQVRETHFLESTDRWKSHDMERTKQAKGTHPLERADKPADRSGLRRNLSEEALTSWKAQTDGYVRTQK
jgi:hypothetical protein